MAGFYVSVIASSLFAVQFLPNGARFCRCVLIISSILSVFGSKAHVFRCVTDCIVKFCELPRMRMFANMNLPPTACVGFNTNGVCKRKQHLVNGKGQKRAICLLLFFSSLSLYFDVQLSKIEANLGATLVKNVLLVTVTTTTGFLICNLFFPDILRSSCSSAGTSVSEPWRARSCSRKSSSKTSSAASSCWKASGRPRPARLDV